LWGYSTAAPHLGTNADKSKSSEVLRFGNWGVTVLRPDKVGGSFANQFSRCLLVLALEDEIGQRG